MIPGETIMPAPAYSGPRRIGPEEYHLHGMRRYITAIALALILFISALDSTIVAVALTTIGADFNDYQQTSWIVTAYLLTYTGFLPIVSKLTDILGRKPVLIGSTLFFMLWSGACGGAKTMNQLLAFRALQGVGGSAIYSGVVLTISTIVPQDAVASYSAIIGLVFSMSSVAGPLIGGAIVQNVHWGWIFFINLPIGAIGAGLLFYALKDPDLGPMKLDILARRVDWFGSILLLSFSVLLAFSLQIGGTPGYPWSSAAVLAPLIISFCLLPAFLLVERRVAEPLVPLRLFRIRNIAAVMPFTLALGAGFFTITIFLPQRMQVVDLRSPITAGVRMLPMLTVLGVLSPLASTSVMLMKRYRPQMWICSAIGAVGAGLLSTLTSPTDFPGQYGGEALIGISFGVTVTVSTIIVQWSVERPDLAAGTGFQSFLRQLGGLVGIAVSTALLNARVEANLDTVSSGPLADPALRNAVTASPSALLPTLDPTTRVYVQEAYSEGFSRVFIAAAAWFAVASLATLALKHQSPELLLQPKTGGGRTVAEEKLDELKRLEAADKEPPV